MAAIPLAPDCRSKAEGCVDKRSSIAEAVRENVPSGSLIFVGGFGQGVPFALGREIIRQGISGLTLCRTGADIIFDLLVAAGAANEIIVGWFGNPGVGLSHVCRRAQREGRLTISETSNFGLLLQLEAAALGVPFMPTRTLVGGDLVGVAERAAITCPFTGEAVSAVPALCPDVALIHAQRADRAGNVQMWGITGDTLVGARAAKRVVCSVEEIVDGEVIRREPGRTVLPGYRVNAIVETPGGAWPSYVQDRYDRDDAYYRAWDKLSRDPDRVRDEVETIRAGPISASGPDRQDRERLAWRA